MALSLTLAERGDVAVYLAGLTTPHPPAQALEADLRKLGSDIALNGRPDAALTDATVVMARMVRRRAAFSGLIGA